MEASLSGSKAFERGFVRDKQYDPLRATKRLFLKSPSVRVTVAREFPIIWPISSWST